MQEEILEKVKELRHLIWEKDIPSPTCSEYQEWHEACQSFLSFIDREILFPSKKHQN